MCKVRKKIKIIIIIKRRELGVQINDLLFVQGDFDIGGEKKISFLTYSLVISVI